jgi:hypothetical protein
MLQPSSSRCSVVVTGFIKEQTRKKVSLPLYSYTSLSFFRFLSSLFLLHKQRPASARQSCGNDWPEILMLRIMLGRCQRERPSLAVDVLENLWLRRLA